MPEVEVVGVHPIEAGEPCHLMEVVIRGASGVDLARFTQADESLIRDDWQVPYDERVLAHGEDEVRPAFFFHYLDLSRPLVTPFGPVALPSESPVPAHLSGIEYERP
jgi:hypothetical protein